MKKILIVDDNEDVRFSIKAGLDDIADYSFAEASSGQEAIDYFKANQADLVLLDIMMPGIDGWDTAAQLQKEEKTKEIPIIFLTAKTDDMSKNMGGIIAKDYVEKPFDVTDLKERIQKVIGQ